MRQRLKTIRLVIIVGIMIMQDFYKYSIKEQKIKDLFHMSDYSTCLERATAILMKSIERALKFYALAIADHRICTHGDNKFEPEAEELAEDLSNKEIKNATRGWWLR